MREPRLSQKMIAYAADQRSLLAYESYLLPWIILTERRFTALQTVIELSWHFKSLAIRMRPLIYACFHILLF